MESFIIITNNNNKKNILRNLSKYKRLYNLKFYSFKELKKKVFFDYDLNTLEYVMNKYKVNLDIAEIYINNLYFLQKLDNEKVSFLNSLKEELKENKLLEEDNDFKKALRNKKIIVYNEEISKEKQIILDNLGQDYEIRNDDTVKYKPMIYQAKTMEEECEFVLNEISKLLEKKIDINKIKIIIPKEYESIIKRYSNFFNIPLNLQNTSSFFSTSIAQEFLSNYDKMALEDNIAILEERYENVNDLIRIINKSAKVINKYYRKEFIIKDLKEEKVTNTIYDKAVSEGSIDDYYDREEYVFLLGFNIDSFPKIYKDDDYLNDEVKAKLKIDTSLDKNILEKKKVLNNIQRIKNLVITYKLNDKKGKCYPSLLIKELGVEVKEIEIAKNICYSKRHASLKYGMMLDNLYKYNIRDEDLYLYQNNLEINYLGYDNSFKYIDNNILKKSFKEGLTLAYTNMEMYNECAFKYYVSRILKLDIFEESFKIIMGKVVHHILELINKRDISIKVEIMQYIKDNNYNLNAQEYFYLDKLSEELVKVVEVLKKQASKSKLNKYLLEEELYVYKDRDINVTFKGLIDKVMYQEINGKEVIVVVDYKTGNTIITLDNLKYGLNLQLPIYLYLLKNSERFKEAVIGGFYIQKVLDNVPNICDKPIEKIREDNLKLQGFSNSDENILALIDEDYKDSTVLKDVKYKQDGSLSAKAKVLSNEEMEKLKEVVNLKIEECIDNILKGEFDINPKVLKDKNIACTYCHFKDICFKKKKDEVVIGGDNDGKDERTEVSN